MHHRIHRTLCVTWAMALAGWCWLSRTSARGRSGTPELRTETLPAGEPAGEEAVLVRAVVGQYCVGCHDGDTAKGGLNLTSVLDEDFGLHPTVWEKVARRLRGRQMPPEGKKRPDEKTYASVVSQLEDALDRAAAAKPNPGRTDTIRRLTRTEYQNAVRDLLGIHIDAATLLPADEASHGF